MKQKFPVSMQRRILARSLDELIVFLLFLPSAEGIIESFQDSGIATFSWSLVLLYFFTKLAYESLGGFLFGATAGKYLLNLRIESTANSKGDLSFAQSLLRAMSFKLSFFMSWAPFALSFSRYDRTHLVDWIAMTRVVQYTDRPMFKFRIYRITSYILFAVLTWYGLTKSFQNFARMEFSSAGITYDLDS